MAQVKSEPSQSSETENERRIVKWHLIILANCNSRESQKYIGHIQRVLQVVVERNGKASGFNRMYIYLFLFVNILKLLIEILLPYCKRYAFWFSILIINQN